ncbi:MAG: hypothetical protein K6A45_01585 [Lachnospiraceae bacterium]|nr:hypothetical protein [Lachnospiraceae bacterium]
MADYTRQIQIKFIKVDGVEYCCTRPGYYYRKSAVGHERITQAEWEEALVWASEMPEPEKTTEPAKDKSSKESIGTDRGIVGEESSKPQEVRTEPPATAAEEESSSPDDFWEGFIV